jgi:hypothetical protein
MHVMLCMGRHKTCPPDLKGVLALYNPFSNVEHLLENPDLEMYVIFHLRAPLIAICIMVTTWEWNWRGKELEEGLAVTKDLTSSAEESVMAIATMAEPIMSNPPPEGSAALSISHMDPYGCMSTCEVWSNGGPKLLGCSVFF